MSENPTPQAPDVQSHLKYVEAIIKQVEEQRNEIMKTTKKSIEQAIQAADQSIKEAQTLCNRAEQQPPSPPHPPES